MKQPKQVKKCRHSWVPYKNGYNLPSTTNMIDVIGAQLEVDKGSTKYDAVFVICQKCLEKRIV